LINYKEKMILYDKNKEINTKSLMERVKLFFKEIYIQWGKEYLSNPIIVWLIIIAVGINVANWISLVIFVKPVDLPIILHYNVYFGVDMMGSWKQVYFLPSLGLLLFLINFLFSVYFYKQKERIASYILLIAALMIQISVLIAAISVIIINY